MNSKIARLVLSALGLALCGWAIWTTSWVGYARHLSSQAKRGNVALSLADLAVGASPSDPNAHYVRGRVLINLKRLPEAARDLAHAVRLQPDDYLSWLQLGYARAQAGDQPGALTAYQEGVRLAPFYGQPRWYLGRHLLRMGRRDEAFAELRTATASDPTLFPDAIELAWREYGDGPAVARALQPERPAARLTLARFLVEQGDVGEALKLVRSAPATSDHERRALLKALLTARHFRAAYEVWRGGAEGREASQSSRELINPGFESDINFAEAGFGWQPSNNLQALRIALDLNGPHSGAQSLRVEFSGSSDPAAAVISQLVLVEPNVRYRLSFAARTEELLTIGYPFVSVVDVSGQEDKILGQSQLLKGETTGWQTHTVEFTTAENTTAVSVRLRRERCESPQCAVLGKLWLDGFALTRL